MHIGLDIGTSAVKAVLIDRDGGLVAESSSPPLTNSRPRWGWSEQDPADWVAGAKTALSLLKSQSSREYGAVDSIGLSGQMHGATVLDDSGKPLVPAILWNDTRSAEEAAELDAKPVFRELTGNIVFPGFTAPKLLWLKRNRPEVFAAAQTVVLPKDFVRLWLTGESVTDMSDASGTAWLDVGRRRWSDQLLAETGLSVDQMPSLVEGTEPGGFLRQSVALELGLRPGLVVAGGGGDNAASGCGIGAVGPGSAFVSLGTSGVLFAVTDRFAPNPGSAVHAFCHALPATWHQMGVILSAAASLEWLARVVGQPPAALADKLGPELAPPSSVKFLPYLSGERTPHNDSAIRGALIGLDHNADAATLTQAVLEGVAFALRDNLDALEVSGMRPSRLVAVGGGARSRYWLQLIATTLGIPVAVPVAGDFGAAFGAARLGLIAATHADALAVCRQPAFIETIDPEPTLAPAFLEAHAGWQALYPAIRGVAA